MLIDIETSSDRHFGFADSGAGYSSLAKARQFLEANGVPAEKIQTINAHDPAVGDVPSVDLAISLISCGFHYPAETYEAFFGAQVNEGGGIVLDIRKGSGGVPYMKRFGALDILSREPKHAMIAVTRGGIDG